MSFLIAWYDLELAEYQKERAETELERVFDERNTTLRDSGLHVTGVHVQPKEFKEPETEWQKTVKTKKGEDYYSKIQELENEQVIKEVKLRSSRTSLPFLERKSSVIHLPKAWPRNIKRICKYSFAAFLLLFFPAQILDHTFLNIHLHPKPDRFYLS